MKIGASSVQIEETAKFNLSEEKVVEMVHKALAPEREIDELKVVR